MLPYAPGARVVIRDEEWLVRRVDPSSDGGHLLNCDGVSELVRGRSALFLTALEDDIKVLDPARTELVADTSSHFNSTFLYLEAQLRRSTPNDDKIHLGHRAVMNLVPYQLDPALQALKQPRQRILIADAVGLGKTLEAGILTTELIQRGRGDRILVVTLKSMLTQFQKEFWSRFSIPLVRLDSVGLQRVRNTIPSNHNPFNYYDRSIISIDTLKGNLEYRNYLENAWWDIIIIDECHNVAARASEDGMSRRARLARMLAGRSDTMILLSATPHDGSARSFASLMSLLDPTAISDPDDYTPEDFRNKGLVMRRFKKDIRDQVSADFQDRVTVRLQQDASQDEEFAYMALLAIPFTQRGQAKAGRQQELQRVGMQKAIFSSPAAALDSTLRRIELLKNKDNITGDEEVEVAALQDFANALRRIDAASFSKFQRLVRHLNSADFAWQPSAPNDRLVIFSERIETLCWLAEHLPTATKLKPNQIEILHGGMTDTEQQSIVERFGRKEDPIRLLLCSDVASEGLNLHYFCHRLVHFDLPWSLMVFQQRNGRVDRYGQTHQPQIIYLFTETRIQRVKGDLRILEILQEKDEQANRNLGDPASFLHIYDPEKEAEKVAEIMAEGTTPEVFEATLDAEQPTTSEDEGDWLLDLFANPEGPDSVVAAPEPSTAHIRAGLTLFGTDAKGTSKPPLSSDYLFAKTALHQLSQPTPLAQFSTDDTGQTVTLTAPLDLQERLRLTLPTEVRDANHRYTLCAHTARMAQAIEEARQANAEEESWPALHYLWPQHPIMDWLADRVLTAFGRHCAPVIQCPQLADGEHAFILMGLIPNRKGQPLLVEWQVAIGHAGNAGGWTLQPFPDFVARSALKAGTLPNRGQSIETTPLQAVLPGAVDTMKRHLITQQKSFSADMQQRLAGTLADLERLQGRQFEQLELRLAANQQAEQFKKSRREQRTQQIRKVFDEYRQWVEDTMTTEPQPFIQVLAAVTR
ncbi:ATP-dependent helicase [Aromatoleum aromaticum EbN1]|uniref:ATP-dependent helicase n=1 Tax=Aromatoleum aromaticum (strain DSM 19018 / LMG 30748 / EbN1) TaxID=76114 RepID=Q5P8V3_AROAE|nr:DEAD/DEAH box helicase [Aromatoleum aromaticum]CAI06256.1 ATP-dependent helicase [Aromatoleum aromaticum EbN1]